MEKLQGPIHPCFLAEHFDIEYSLEQEFTNTKRLRYEDEQKEAEYSSLPSLNDKMPFLQMLQSADTPQFMSFQESNFQTFLRLQQLKKPCDDNDEHSNMYFSEVNPHQVQTLELESCITQLHSSNKDANISAETCCKAKVNSPGQQKPKSKKTQMAKTPLCARKERKKRKRTRPAKNKEDVERQRMTHIAVERNRRRQMNEHLNALRILMPASYVPRGDQASIIGGAIDFVKELEQLLQSLEAQKSIIRSAAEDGSESSSSNPMAACEGLTTEGREEKVVVSVTQNHVNLKVQCENRPGQLLKAIVALENLRLTVVHVNITSSHTCVHYSFNLKIEDGCELGLPDDIVAAVHQIFRFIA